MNEINNSLDCEKLITPASLSLNESEYEINDEYFF